ncbi:hypothetical protein LPJ57_001534 [Coemansia sp. RSA 486]|nr:hypothetical protein LPJ57_001534 [Coemansia sp. RSA 486]KAJ2231376.1 hypothetical protein IWW45_005497 [Coemansia sp. RSA 485]
MAFAAKTSALSTRTLAGLRRATATTRGAAKREKAAARGGPSHLSSDPRYEAMKQIMFQDEPRQLPKLTLEDVERHQTILRAVEVVRMEDRRERRGERQRKFDAMENAYEALEKVDPRLYKAACVKEANVVFPRQMRVPTETPAKKIWDYLE